jgi:hypothetical protein
MKIENLKVGMIYKNYKVMCELLEQPVNSGKSKQLQMKNWERYFSYEKDGVKFIVNEIFNIPLDKEDRRGKGNNKVKESLIDTNPILASEWLIKENGMKIPSTLTRTSTEKYWWKCSECKNKIYESPARRSRNEKNVSDSSKCPYCSLSKNAKKIYKFLDKSGIKFKLEYTFEDLKGVGGSNLRFDFAIFHNDNLVLLVEYDGEYHDKNLNPYADKYVVLNTHDNLKDAYCKENNITLLRISYLESYGIIQILKRELIKYNLIDDQMDGDLEMENEFKLMSINVIAYLKMKNIKPLRIEKTEEGNVAHYFNNNDELHFYLKEYKKDKYIQSFITHLVDTRKQIKSLV